MYKMQFIVSVSVKEHLVNPEIFFFFFFGEATQSSENARAFVFRNLALTLSFLVVVTKAGHIPFLISVFSSG